MRRGNGKSDKPAFENWQLKIKTIIILAWFHNHQYLYHIANNWYFRLNSENIFICTINENPKLNY
jgi:hypothetical protein